MAEWANFRELGGYIGDGGRVIRRGMLYRAALPKLSLTDWHRYTSQYCLQTVVNLMGGFSDEQSNPNFPPVAYHDGSFSHEDLPVEIKPLALKTDDQLMAEMLRRKPIEHWGYDDMHSYYKYLATSPSLSWVIQSFKQEVLALEKDRALVYHCFSGKDRTGIITAMLMTALGCTQESIEYEYGLSRHQIDSLKTLSDVEDKVLVSDIAMYEVSVDWLRSFLNEVSPRIDLEGGSQRADLLLSHDDVMALREKLLI